MKIENYGFGSIKINGNVFKNDVIILPDKIIPEWWRKQGHQLHLEDLTFLDKFIPKTLVVGCGYYGLMKIKPEVKKYCDQNNIELITNNSREAVKTYNRLSDQPDVVGAFHLTC